MEDALKRLDKSTQEEARMATAEVLRTSHAIDQSVRGVREQVLAVDKRVASVGDRVASVNDRVSSIDNRVAEVMNGAQIVINQRNAYFEALRRKGSKAIHETNGQLYRSGETFVIA